MNIKRIIRLQLNSTFEHKIGSIQIKQSSIIIILSLFIAGLSLIAFISPTEAANNSVISQVQTKLRDLGFDPGPIDGVWGGKTKKALEDYQLKNELPITGKLDTATREKLGLPEGHIIGAKVQPPDGIYEGVNDLGGILKINFVEDEIPYNFIVINPNLENGGKVALAPKECTIKHFSCKGIEIATQDSKVRNGIISTKKYGKIYFTYAGFYLTKTQEESLKKIDSSE